jgi:hypothetical protein
MEESPHYRLLGLLNLPCMVFDYPTLFFYQTHLPPNVTNGPFLRSPWGIRLALTFHSVQTCTTILLRSDREALEGRLVSMFGLISCCIESAGFP